MTAFRTAWMENLDLINPYKMNLICPRSSQPLRVTPEEKRDDLLLMAGILAIDPALVENVVDEIHAFPHANVRKIRFKHEDDRRTMWLDLDGAVPGLSFNALGGIQQETVLIEFATALARFWGRYAPTLLIMDGFIFGFFKGWFNYHSHRLLDPENRFQTVLTMPTQKLDLGEVQLNGWQVIRTHGQPPHCKVEQEI
jgi:hypothetical protein